MRKYFLYVFFLIFLFSGCGIIKNKNEGSIIYEIIFDEEEKESNPVIGLLPTEMTLYFKDNSSKSMIEGFMGMFLSAYISDAENKTNSFLFKVMADKHYCQTNFGEASLGFDEMPNIIIEETKEEIEMVGVTAKKVYVRFKDTSHEPYELYYTEDIKIHNPNWNNPFRSINGVLLDFRLKMRGISMHLKAKEIIYEEISEQEFVVPDDFKRVSPDTLNAIVDEIMNSAKF